MGWRLQGYTAGGSGNDSHGFGLGSLIVRRRVSLFRFRWDSVTAFLFPIASKEFFQKFLLVTDNPLEQVGLRSHQGTGNSKIQIAAPAICCRREVFFQFVRYFLTEELAYREPPVQTKFLRRLNCSPEINLAVF